MKKRVLSLIILCFVLLISLTGCGKSEDEVQEENKNVSVMSNSNINVDGIYLNNDYESDEGLKQVIVFYTVTATDENLRVTSLLLYLNIGKNEYSADYNEDTPELTQYYYGNVVKDLYTGNSQKVAAIYEVSGGDLVSGNEITFVNKNSYNITNDLKIYVDDIKEMDNLTDISLDVDKDYATDKYNEYLANMEDADEATVSQVQNDINGYYFEFKGYIGTNYVKYNLEFSDPNNFEVTMTMSGNSVTFSGTYTVKKGFIALTYSHDTDSSNIIYMKYSYEDGEIHATNPFFTDGTTEKSF